LKSVMFCWELGGGLGHVTKAVLLAERLLDEGCSITFAFRDLAEVHALLPMDDYRIVQSPVWGRTLPGAGAPASYAELLLHFGFASPTGMAGLCRAWRSLYQAFSIDLVIADHAPNAILAARTLGVPAVLYGNGFFAPPEQKPLQPYRSSPGQQVRLAAAEELALRSANNCLTTFGSPELDHLSELLQVERSFLCTVPELDHYLGRERGEYCGPVYVDRIGHRLAWSGATDGQPGRRIFAYLKAQMAGLPDLLSSLAACGARVAIYCAGIDPELIRQYSATSLQFVNGLVNLQDVVETVDLLLCGGTDTAYCALFNGVPVLSVPLTMEQRITGERIEAIGAGLCVPLGRGADQWSAAIDRLLSQESYAAAAKTFAQRHEGQTPDAAITHIANQCIALLDRERDG